MKVTNKNKNLLFFWKIKILSFLNCLGEASNTDQVQGIEAGNMQTKSGGGPGRRGRPRYRRSPRNKNADIEHSSAGGDKEAQPVQNTTTESSA